MVVLCKNLKIIHSGSICFMYGVKFNLPLFIETYKNHLNIIKIPATLNSTSLQFVAISQNDV